MNINKIKIKITQLVDKNLKIRVNLGRNKYEYLEGKIDRIHKNIFTINTNKGIRSFSYSDIVTKAVVITEF